MSPYRSARRGNRCTADWTRYKVYNSVGTRLCRAPHLFAAGPRFCCFTAQHGCVAAQRFAESAYGEEQGGAAAGSAASLVIGVSGRQASVFDAPETHARSYVKRLARRFRLGPGGCVIRALHSFSAAWGGRACPSCQGYDSRAGHVVQAGSCEFHCRLAGVISPAAAATLRTFRSVPRAARKNARAPPGYTRLLHAAVTPVVLLDYAKKPRDGTKKEKVKGKAGVSSLTPGVPFAVRELPFFV
ncbi:hypothetical protein HPB51_014657 [Rhipicephalus microplus]|uniref:Uncharacterized protein n=1 Tax=Rhipicephalus microplus TaxID=6941 RepID=A0A9J6F5I2_RHIMP|nr:hypothetical protein HPB51_014657 [Rhipicephalus microplus]